MPRFPAQRANIASKSAAVEFLIDYYLGPDGPDTIYAPIGPQTNLALALRLEPKIARRIRASSLWRAYLEGNTTPSAEFNILADPEAAAIVFNSGISITMVGLEVTAQALVTLEDATAWLRWQPLGKNSSNADPQ